MKYKIFTYDSFQIDEFENKLNDLSKQGINPIEINYISKFNQDHKHYFYKIDVLKGNEMQARKQLMDLYDSYSYRYIGKRGRLIFFQGDQKKYPKQRDDKIEDYLNNQLLSISILLFIVGLFLCLCIPYLFSHDLSHYQTNGQILLYWIPFMIGISIFLFGFIKLMHFVQYKANKKRQKSFLSTIALGLLILSILCLPIGCALDWFSRTKTQVDCMTLSDFNKQSTVQTMSQAHSMVVDTKTCVDSNDEDILFQTIYEVHNDVDDYYDVFVQSHRTEEYQKLDNGYLYTSDIKNDSLILKIDNKIIDITATFDLEPYIEQINLFYD